MQTCCEFSINQSRSPVKLYSPAPPHISGTQQKFPEELYANSHLFSLYSPPLQLLVKITNKLLTACGQFLAFIFIQLPFDNRCCSIRLEMSFSSLPGHSTLLVFLLFCWFLFIFLTSEQWHAWDSVRRPYQSILTLLVSSSVFGLKIKQLVVTHRSDTYFFPGLQTCMF